MELPHANPAGTEVAAEKIAATEVAAMQVAGVQHPADSPQPRSSVDGRDAPAAARVSVRDRRLLMQRVGELGPTEHQEIFKMLARHGVTYTQNKNGVFVNLSQMDDAVVRDIRRFVDFCMDNKSTLDEYDQRLNECKLSQNYDGMMSRGAVGGGGDAQHPHPPGEGAASGTAAEPGACTADAAQQQQAASRAAAVAGAAMHALNYSKRMINSKFNLAKKKFARRKVIDRPKAHENAAGSSWPTELIQPSTQAGSGMAELQPEAFLIP